MGAVKGPWGFGCCKGARFWVQGACTEVTAPSRMHRVRRFGGVVERGHGLGRGVLRGHQDAAPHLPGWLLRPLQPSSSPGIPEVQAEGVREHLGHPWHGSSSGVTATSRAVGTSKMARGSGGGHVTSGGPTGRVIPQAPAALLEVGTGLPAVPGRDGDLAAAVLAADPARGAAAAPGPPGSHHAAHRCRAWRRSRGEGKEGKKSLNSIKDKGEKLCRGESRDPPRGSSPSPAALCAASGGFYSHAAASS